MNSKKAKAVPILREKHEKKEDNLLSLFYTKTLFLMRPFSGVVTR